MRTGGWQSLLWSFSVLTRLSLEVLSVFMRQPKSAHSVSLAFILLDILQTYCKTILSNGELDLAHHEASSRARL